MVNKMQTRPRHVNNFMKCMTRGAFMTRGVFSGEVTGPRLTPQTNQIMVRQNASYEHKIARLEPSWLAALSSVFTIMLVFSSSNLVVFAADLQVPRFNSTFGERSFGVAGPRLWNDFLKDFRNTGLSVGTWQTSQNAKSTVFYFMRLRRFVTVRFLCAVHKCSYFTYLQVLCLWTPLGGDSPHLPSLKTPPFMIIWTNFRWQHEGLTCLNVSVLMALWHATAVTTIIERHRERER